MFSLSGQAMVPVLLRGPTSSGWMMPTLAASRRRDFLAAREQKLVFLVLAFHRRSPHGIAGG
jgi:hypothetical protein